MINMEVKVPRPTMNHVIHDETKIQSDINIGETQVPGVFMEEVTASGGIGRASKWSWQVSDTLKN